MTATTPGRFRKVAASSVVGLLVASTCLVFSALPASAAPPTIVNSGVSGGPGGLPNWLEDNVVNRNNHSGSSGLDTKLFSTLIVKHDEGRTVTGVAIDSDWGATDETASVTPTPVTATYIPGATTNYSAVRFSFEPPNHPDARTDPILSFCGGNNSNPSGPMRLAAVLDDGTRTAPVSFTVTQLMELGCSGVGEKPVMYNQSQTATTATPGQTVTFTFQGDDPDAGLGSFTSNDAFDKVRWRVRRLNDGAIVQGPTCLDVAGSGGSDGTTVNLPVTITAAQGRGRYVVEAELGSENDSINNSTPATCAASSLGSGGLFARVGSFDVNSAATATTLSLSGAPALVQAGTSYTVTANAADTDTTGRVQAIEWDADGIAGSERRVLADEPAGLSTTDKQQLVATTVGQCADRTVTAQITDNGAMNAADAVRVQKSASASTVVNCAPVADDQGVTTNEDTPQPFTLAPTDGDLDPLTYSVVTPPAHGAVSGTFPSFVYNPNANFNGTDSYDYKVDDGHGASDTAKVTFTVSAINDQPHAQDVVTNTDEDTPLVIDMSPYISDPDQPGQTLSVSVLTQPATGVATPTDATHISYTPNPPADFNGVVSFTYQVDDGQGLANSTDNGSITITVNPIDDPPVAPNQTVTTDEDTPLTLTLGPTTDADGETVTYSVPTPIQPANGSVTVAGTSATYTPNHDYNGADSFMFQATDGNSVVTGTITITVNPVNDAPIATPQAVSTLEDTALPITLSATDVDNTPDQLTYTVITPPTHGQLDATTGASIVYTPDLNYNGPDSLTFQVSDGALTSTASVSITVIPVNDPPVPDPQAVSTDEDTPLPILLTASDVDNTQAQLSYSVTVPPQHGTLNSSTGANLVYTPNLNENGPDSFQFAVSDGQYSVPADVTITINPTNDPPTAIPQSLSTPEDTALPITLDATDPDDPTSDLTFAVLSGPSHGSLDTTSGAALSYTPTTDFNGFDAFVFQVTDPSGRTDIATVTIAVGDTGTNDPPAGTDQAVTTDEDTDVGFAVSGTDVDGDDLTYSVEVPPTNGTAVMQDGSVIYSPNLNFHGSDMLIFKVDDGHGGIGFGQVSIDVTSVNDAPDAIPATVELLEDTPTAVTLTATDVDGDPITFAVVTGPSHGHLTGTAPDVVYTPSQDYFGNDAFTFSATDSHGASSTATVSLIVDPAPKTVTSLYAEPAIATILHNGVALKISIPLTAHLTNKVTGQGLAGKTIVFSSSTNALLNLCTAVTDSTGTAHCTAISSSLSAIVNLGYTAFFAGDEDNLAVSDAGTLIRIINIRVP